MAQIEKRTAIKNGKLMKGEKRSANDAFFLNSFRNGKEKRK